MLRFQRTPVTQNAKCESCLHYDGNAQAKAGACEVGTQPFMCGDGSTPRFGFAPLTDMSPDMMEDLAAPAQAGTHGAMNEHGHLEKEVKMQTHVLGDEHVSLARRIKGDWDSMHKGFVAPVQGQVGLCCPENVGAFPHENSAGTTFNVAKSLYDNLRPSLRHRYNLDEVLMFLGANGFEVTDADITKTRS